MAVQGSSLWLLTISICAIVFIYLASYLWKNIQLMRYFSKDNVPYRKSLPFIGFMLPVLTKTKSFTDMFRDLYNEFPNARYSGCFEFTTPNYILRDTELIKLVTVKHFDSFSDHKGIVDSTIDPLLGGNLFAMRGEHWKEMRAIIAPVFTSSKMRIMFELISKCADNLTKYLEKQPRLLNFDMKDMFTRYTNDVIATAAFGISVDSLANKENEFYMMGNEATNFRGFNPIKVLMLSLSPKLSKLLNQKLVSTKASNYFTGLIRDAVSTREKNGIVRPDLIHLLMQAKHKENDKKLTIDEITAQAFIFFFAGFDTASTLMCLACHQLAIYPEIQDKLLAELDAAFMEEPKLSYEKINQLQYLDMFLNETLRFYPPAAMSDRLCTKEFELPPATETAKPVLLKPGSRLCIVMCGLHHDPKYFPEPEKFDPERFSPENKRNINPFAFLPFGVGRRSCPGNRFTLMETKIVLTTILRKFRFVVGAKTHLPFEVSKSTLIMTAEHGFWLDLQPRNTVIS